MNSLSQIVELSDYQFIRILGPDARKFLQGQLSCNLDNLSEQRSLRGAICNLKGRVIADLRLIGVPEGCLLQVAPGMGPVVVTTLSKYAVFSKVKLELLDSPPEVFGVLGALPDQVLQGFDSIPEQSDGLVQNAAASLIRIAGEQPRFEIWTHDRDAAGTLISALQQGRLADLSAWRRADIQAGIIHVNAAMTEEYTPQLLNYDISGVIDFKKGCYTGQEVVARMFYRGIAKKRLYLASTTANLTADDAVHADGESADKHAPILAFSNGSADGDDATLLLTVLETEAVQAGRAFTLAGQPEATLSVLPLAY